MALMDRVSRFLVMILLWSTRASGQPIMCDQTPPGAKVLTPQDSNNSPYSLKISTKIGSNTMFLPGQTYVLILESSNPTRPFKGFMITLEDAEMDTNKYSFEHRNVDVGDLETLEGDLKSRHSERCSNSVENNDNSDKTRIEIHWVSPKDHGDRIDRTQKIRFRAMVYENNEVWYTGETLTITLAKDNSPPVDRPPIEATPTCNLCSEARYELVFRGQWSRGYHSLHYPSKPDEMMYSHMVGASHHFDYTLWEKGSEASSALQRLAENADIVDLEREIIKEMALTSGTRTLIRGKMHKHPHMHEPSHSLFRVDRHHHLFSVLVALKPSPDWFLGISRFELCNESSWLDHYIIPMYPYDAGTTNGISYDSETSVTLPREKVDTVALGSFNRDSPFYQLNQNDLKEFALLEITKLNEYPLSDVDCEDASEGEDTLVGNKDMVEEEEEEEDPKMAESRSECTGEWSEWSTCVPHEGDCGLGIQSRTRSMDNFNYYNVNDREDVEASPLERCQREQETQQCFVNCY